MQFVLQFKGQIREPEGRTETAPKTRRSILTESKTNDAHESKS